MLENSGKCTGYYIYLPNMSTGRTILSSKRLELTLDRLCYSILENHPNLENTVLIGIQPRGVLLADKIYKRLLVLSNQDKIPYGKIDITFYRDDFRKRDEPIRAATTEIDFLVEDKNVILIDDVLYTGRTIHAAMSALQDFGRPSKIELMCLIDRRFNRQFPIMSNYIGMVVDALNEAYVRVNWGKKSEVLLFANKKEAQNS